MIRHVFPKISPPLCGCVAMVERGKWAASEVLEAAEAEPEHTRPKLFRKKTLKE
ncbi:MAG: hypothetical protein ABSH06_21350 [Thermodesulfobacteriota bacterium]